MEGSWLVTPPPCFMSRSQCLDNTTDVRAIENLLIEHPSMSVYGTTTAAMPNTTQALRTVNSSRRQQRTLAHQPIEQQMFGCDIEPRPQWLRSKRRVCRDRSVIENCVNSAAIRHNKTAALRMRNKHLTTFNRRH